MNENNTPKSNKKISKEESPKYSSKENQNLEVPSVPIAPKKKQGITSKSPGLSTDLIKKIKALESIYVKVVLVNCERCGEIIAVPITRTSIDRSELPIVPISYVHINSKGKDPHCITLFLDHDYDIRRQRISDVIIEKSLENR